MNPVGDTGDPKERISPAIEDYLKAIYTLGRSQPQVTTSLLADHLGFKPASVTGMLKTMADLQLVRYTPYHGVELTHAGERIALEVVRHHRLLELYLVEALGYGWDEVHDEAEILEHAVSDRMLARLDAKLGFPERDPHGDPIPRTDGSVPTPDACLLSDLDTGQSGRVARISDDDPNMLRYFDEVGVALDSILTIREKRPFAGTISVAIDNATTVDLGDIATRAIFIVTT